MKKVIDIDAEFDSVFFDEKSIQKYTAGQKASATMRGKTLEEMIGKEAAAKGRQVRAVNARGPRPPEVMQKIAATRRANNSYGTSMLGKEHKTSTKEIMAIKAKIRQDLRRKLNMGKSGTLPKELLEAEYKQAGL